jgi:hypothetical protein
MSRLTRANRIRYPASLGSVALAAVLLAASLVGQVATGQELPSAPSVATPLATSLEEGSGSWVAVAMGHLNQPLNTFWQLFFRPSASSRWSDVVAGTAVATNGGLVLAALGSGSLLLGVLPSHLLRFSPLLFSADGGRTYTPELVLMEGLAERPDALSASAGGHELALVGSGTGTQVLQTAPGLTGWHVLASESQLASSAGGHSCGLASITAVSFDASQPVLGAACEVQNAVGIFVERNGAWQLAGPNLPSSLARGQVEVLGLRRSGRGLSALFAVSQGSRTSIVGAWTSAGLTHWTISSVLRFGDLKVESFGPSSGPGWFVLTTDPSGAKSLEVLGSTASWVRLPTPPAQSATAAFGPGPNVDVLGVNGGLMTDWRLASSRWAKTQVIDVPIPYGSSD